MSKIFKVHAAKYGYELLTLCGNYRWGRKGTSQVTHVPRSVTCLTCLRLMNKQGRK